ncbi:ArnT family glycosyltransferase [Hymenobacter convexus]|uniref:ArnT family glycosyltransferase n=1 Tax=Hymenobacter sp. CA1UV-4 TaxID=3063782 RepID=UPI0027142C98|nr:glycosyltransferase family 39 protein [Hymenobacter sp. CA1UV-4]MDO7850086.1 glycosyltransferase family 39 protein [Hymenobacter sp. CA1UV-4]
MAQFLASFSSRFHGWRGALLVAVLAYLPLFWLLASHPVQPWDEARTGINAINILRNHDWLVLRDAFQQPDLWNCKPPLWPWLLALSFKLLGPTELGLRLPAALAGLATALVVYRAGRRWLGGWEGGVLAALVLLTSAGYVGYHVARSGDFDALLTLWTTCGTLAWLRYLAEGRDRHAWLTGLFFLLAAFTKGVAGLMFGPGLVLATFALGQGQRLRRPAPWLALLPLVLGLGTWYVLREHILPGYWQAVWDYELGGPAGSQLEGHKSRFYYYLAGLTETKFIFWVVPAVLGGLLGWWLPTENRVRWLVRLAVCVAGTFLLILALTQTRLPWYDAPVFPVLALLAAAGLLPAARAVAAQQGWRPGPVARLGALALVLALPYWALCRTLVRTYDARYQQVAQQVGHHIRQQARARPEVQDYYFGTPGEYSESLLFYQAAAELQFGHRITAVPPWELLKTTAGREVVVCGKATRRAWENYYRTSVVLETDSCVTLRLEARR